MFTPKIPDIPIKPLLEELVSIAQKAETSDEYDSAGIMFKFSFPATESELKEIETYLKNSERAFMNEELYILNWSFFRLFFR